MSLFQPQVILPVQVLNPTLELIPERRLMVAVLEDAVWCVEKYRFPTNAEGRRLFRNARQWLLAVEPHWPYSFERICVVLDLDADAVRLRLRLGPEPPSVSASRKMSTAVRASGIADAAPSDTSVGAAAGS